MPRKRRQLKARQATVSETALHVLSDELFEPIEDINEFEAWELRYPREGDRAIERVWRDACEQIVAAFQELRPCSRPQAWWRYDAPEPRRRTGGIGTPRHEVLSWMPVFVRGIPAHFITPDDVEIFKKIDPAFRGEPVSPLSPARYESEAAYLGRHGLLSAVERRHLQKHPELLNDELIEFEEPKDAE